MRDFWFLEQFQSSVTVGVYFFLKSQRLQNLGQSRDFGTFPVAQEIPGRVGLSKKPRTVQKPESRHHRGLFFSQRPKSHNLKFFFTLAVGLWK